MPEYLTPGVYVEEFDRGPKPIEGVGTAMPVFIGFSEKAQSSEIVDGESVITDLLGKATLVTNWSQYVERFGGFVQGIHMPHAVYGYFMNGGTRAYVVSVKAIPRAQAGLLNGDGQALLVVKAKQAGFDAMRLRVKVEAPVLPAPSAADKKAAKKEGEEPGAAPAIGSTFNLTVEKEKLGGGWLVQEVLKDIALAEVEKEDGTKAVGVAFKDNKAPQLVEILVADAAAPLVKVMPREQQQSLTIESKLLAAPTTREFQGEVMERTGVEGLESYDDITMAVVPDLMTTLPGQKLDLNMVKAVQTLLIAHCEKMGDRVAILDTPPNMNPQQVKKWRMETAGYDSSFAALYYPWIEIMDPVTNRPTLIPPSGHMAGIWARSDTTRGVHKAPANEVVRGATGLAVNCTKGEQAILNPFGINCIRAFPGMGIRVWGARSMASNPAWRYINVRRLFNFVEKSIERGTQWTVFEPNDPMLWSQVRRDVTAFLTLVWRDGALFGGSPSDAFYVKCDAELNPQEVRDAGRLIIEIGLAPVKPAEFVIFRITQWAPGA